MLVSGGSRGIGRAIVEQLAIQGAHVVFTYHRQHETAQALVRTIREQGMICHAKQCDLNAPDESRAMVEAIEEEFGEIYALVNNAGITQDKSFPTMSETDWLSVISTNLNGTALLTQAVLQKMMFRKEGRIIMMSSVGGLRASSGQSNYSSTKAALIGLTRTLSHEMARFNILVNAVAPGYIATDMVLSMPESSRSAIPKQVPLRRMGAVEEVAAPVLFLLSDSASYITGHCMVVDGGLSA
ncbi:3-oxoacyl-ACP reductase FabG [Zobellella sp. DQSA1]|uniref:3-oxoacyl-ACP reductase FabG n=1 Tax=Zobellella sp. DQSA1 TaxID=3342386 RepID=UPI0035C0F3E5